MKEFLINNFQTNPAGEDWEKAVQEFMSRLSRKEKPESTTIPQYEYGVVSVEDVIRNPEEYVIPECLEACKTLWGKNIETRMCANYDGNNNLFIQFFDGDGLSYENKEVFITNAERGFWMGEEHDFPSISVPGQSAESAATLVRLVDKLKIQDVRSCRYKTSKEFLEEFKCDGMPIEYDGWDECGNVIVARREYKPERENTTLEDALEQTNKTGLYIPAEDRVYESQMFLDWHNRFLKSKES